MTDAGADTPCQRWSDGRDTYRRDGARFDPRAHEVLELPDDTTARAFVERHHYSGTYPAALRRFALMRRGALAGVAVFSVPSNDLAVTNALPIGPREGCELGRFVLLDEVERNGETWFLARCLRALARTGVRGVVSFSDPEPRRTAAGAVRFGGHVGTIYQAGNAAYLGRSTPRTLRVLPDGTVFSARAASKIRARERGWAYAVGQLVAAGAPEPAGDSRAELRAFLERALATVTRPMRHHGNHRYAWALDRRLSVASTAPYPKLHDGRQLPLF